MWCLKVVYLPSDFCLVCSSFLYLYIKLETILWWPAATLNWCVWCNGKKKNCVRSENVYCCLMQGMYKIKHDTVHVFCQTQNPVMCSIVLYAPIYHCQQCDPIASCSVVTQNEHSPMDPSLINTTTTLWQPSFNSTFILFSTTHLSSFVTAFCAVALPSWWQNPVFPTH